MTRVAIRFAYDGTRFDSFARQPGKRTVEAELLSSLQEIGAIRGAREANYSVASRTDRGVSAWGNVCAVDVDIEPRLVAHRARPPPGLWLLGAATVADDFSPRAAATRRVYRYALEDARVLDLKAMRVAARLFVGVHDFSNYCRKEPGATTRRRIDSIHVRREGTAAHVRFAAPNFLWEQIRRIMHALLAVGAETRALASTRRRLAGHGSPEAPAAPEPLVLEDVEIPVRFPPISKALSARLEAERVAAWARSRFYAGFPSRRPTVRR